MFVSRSSHSRHLALSDVSACLRPFLLRDPPGATPRRTAGRPADAARSAASLDRLAGRSQTAKVDRLTEEASMHVFVLDRREPVHIWAEVSLPSIVWESIRNRDFDLNSLEDVPSNGHSMALSVEQLLKRPDGDRILKAWRRGDRSAQDLVERQSRGAYALGEVAQLAADGCPDARTLLSAPWDEEVAWTFVLNHICNHELGPRSIEGSGPNRLAR